MRLLPPCYRYASCCRPGRRMPPSRRSPSPSPTAGAALAATTPREARHAWLGKKALHDSEAGATPSLPAAETAHLWMVHGQWYDLASFAERHPGGAFWLTQTVGMDVTELYETHHLGMEKADAILKARLVGPAAPGYSSFYDYEPAGLYCTLKRRVAAALEAEGGSDATAAFKAQCAAVSIAHLACFAALCLSGAGGSLLWATLTGITISALHGIGHNFLRKPPRYRCHLGCILLKMAATSLLADQADSPWMWVCM